MQIALELIFTRCFRNLMIHVMVEYLGTRPTEDVCNEKTKKTVLF